MKKSKASLIILGSILIFLSTIVATYFGLLSMGVIEPKPIEITVTTFDDVKEYDGTPLVASEFEVSEGKLVKGHYIEMTYVESITNVGSIYTTGAARIYDENGYEVTEDYSIRYEAAKLTIRQKELLMIVNHEHIYDGKAAYLSSDDYLIESGELVSGHKIASKISDEIINVNSNPIIEKLIPSIIDYNGNDVSMNYDITLNIGEIVVNPQVIRIKSLSASQNYNGLVLKNDNYEIISGTLFNDHKLDIQFTPDIEFINVGVMENKFTAVVKDESGVDVSANYSLICEFGKLEITKQDIIVTTCDYEKVYDDSPITKADKYTISGPIAEYHTLTVEFESHNSVDVGLYQNTVNVIKIFNGGNIDVTSNYNIVVNEGLLKIKAKDVVVTTTSFSKEYDGAFVYPEAECSDLLTNHVFTYEFLNSSYKEGYSDAGLYVNEIKNLKVTASSKDVTDNYNFIVVTGHVTITPKKATITTSSKYTTYNGKSISNEYVITGLVSGHKENVKLSNDSFTDVGTYVNDIKSYSISNANSKDVTPNYDISVNVGIVTISPILLTITSYSETKTYDGATISANKCNVVGDILEGHTVEFTSDLTDIKDSGTYINSGKYKINDSSDKDVSKNYDITFTPGQIVINPVKIIITSHSETKKYDGIEVDVNKFEIVGTDSFTVSFESNLSKIKNAGNYINYGKYQIKDSNDADASINCDVTFIPGVITINKKSAVITTKGGKVAYGQNHKFGFEKTGLIDGHDFIPTDGSKIFNTYGTIEAGVTSGRIVSGTEDVTDNYLISYVMGTFNVQLRYSSYGNSVTIEYNGNLDFDDELLKALGATVTVYGLAPGHYCDYDFDPITEDDFVDNMATISYTVVIRDSNGRTVNNYIDEEVVCGSIIIKKKDVYVTAPSVSKEYDGTALTVSNSTPPSVSGLISGDTFTVVSYAGSQTAVGTSTNKIQSYNLTNSDYYNVILFDGTLTVVN